MSYQVVGKSKKGGKKTLQTNQESVALCEILRSKTLKKENKQLVEIGVKAKRSEEDNAIR